MKISTCGRLWVAAWAMLTLWQAPAADLKLLKQPIALSGETCNQAERKLNEHRGILCLTFDDACFPGWRKMLPLFEKYHAHATFFVNGKIDAKRIADIREFQAKGHSIGLHGFKHQKASARMKALGEEAYLAEEVLPQIAALKAAQIEAKNWAYPMSARNAATDAALAKHFTRMRTGHIFARNPEKQPLATCDGAFASRKGLEKRLVLPGMGIGSQFPGLADDFERGLERLAAKDELLVIYSHNVKDAPDGSPHNTSLDVIERILKKAAELKIAVVGFDELPRVQSASAL